MSQLHTPAPYTAWLAVERRRSDALSFAVTSVAAMARGEQRPAVAALTAVHDRLIEVEQCNDELLAARAALPDALQGPERRLLEAVFAPADAQPVLQIAA